MDTTIRSKGTTTTDAIKLLKEQHDEVKTMFKKFEELGDRAYTSKKKLADQICAALTKHALIEEEIFYPAVRAEVEEGDEQVDEAVVEHDSAKELIAQIQEMSANEELFDAKVKVLGEQVEHHIKEEETEMFRDAKKAKLDLVQLGQQMETRWQELSAQGI